MHADTWLGSDGTRSLFRLYINVIVDRYIFGSYNDCVEAETGLNCKTTTQLLIITFYLDFIFFVFDSLANFLFAVSEIFVEKKGFLCLHCLPFLIV